MVSKEILEQGCYVREFPVRRVVPDGWSFMKHPVATRCGRGGVDPYRAHNPETQFESDVRHLSSSMLPLAREVRGSGSRAPRHNPGWWEHLKGCGGSTKTSAPVRHQRTGAAWCFGPYGAGYSSGAFAGPVTSFSSCTWSVWVATSLYSSSKSSLLANTSSGATMPCAATT